MAVHVFMPLEWDRWKADVTCMQEDKTAVAANSIENGDWLGFCDKDRRLSEFMQASDVVDADEECEESSCRRRCLRLASGERLILGKEMQL